jgi:hypothetical protein
MGKKERARAGCRPQQPAHSGETASARDVTVLLLRRLLNTLRLASGPAEAASVLRFFWKALIWRLARPSGANEDETLRVTGITHVLGLGSGELFIPQEIYWETAYERLADFVTQACWVVFDVGANAGVYAVQQARRGSHVYAFEPNPNCYRR